MGWCMPVAAIVKYLFILFCTGNRNPVLYMGKQALQRMDGRNDCGNYNDRDEYIGTSDSEYGEKALILGISEGVIVFALAVLFHYGIGMGSQIFRERHKNRVEEEGVETMVGMDLRGGFMHLQRQLTSFPVAFAAMDGRQKAQTAESSGYSCPGDYRKAVCGLRWMCRVFRAAETGFLDKNPPDAAGSCTTQYQRRNFKSEFYGRVSALFRDGGRGNLGFFPYGTQ